MINTLLKSICTEIDQKILGADLKSQFIQLKTGEESLVPNTLNVVLFKSKVEHETLGLSNYSVQNAYKKGMLQKPPLKLSVDILLICNFSNYRIAVSVYSQILEYFYNHDTINIPFEGYPNEVEIDLSSFSDRDEIELWNTFKVPGVPILRYNFSPLMLPGKMDSDLKTAGEQNESSVEEEKTKPQTSPQKTKIMAKQYKTPGVYVVEKDSFGSSIVANETAIPAFIGFTEYATQSNGEELGLIKNSKIVREPVLVHSMLEYQQSFGGADETGVITVTSKEDESGNTTYSAKNTKDDKDYTPGFMEPSVSSFFSNGGGSCYIISLGSYSDFSDSFAAKITDEMNFIEQAIEMAQTTTLILPTDLLRFGTKNYYTWGTQFINFSQQEKKYFTVMDVIQADAMSPDFNTKDISNYRDLVKPEFPSYAGAYYPYLKSLTPYAYKSDLSNVTLDGNPLTSADNATKEAVKTFLATNYINMPSSPFMAGIYSRLDNATGVWTPPANVAPIGVTGPLVPLTNKQQENLNVDPTAGKSVNAIRSFTGKGTLVWGARTNDGNSMDWRYVNVRRLFISMETDISMALEAYVFKPNVHNTWVEVKTMIESYLLGLYGQGAFAGTTPETSYQVLIGKGVTMTDEDVLNGYMRVSIMVAPVRPAEFIVLTFTQMVGQ